MPENADSQACVREPHFAQLLDAAPDAIVVVSAAGRIDFVNEQTEKLFGYPRAEPVGAALESLIPERMRLSHGQLLVLYVEG